MNNILLVVSLNLLATALSTLNCDNYTCDSKLVDPMCASFVQQIVNVKYSLKTCSNKKQFCPVNQLNREDPKSTVNCLDRIDNNKRYPGGVCQKDDDCVGGQCADNKCVGLGEGKLCNETKQCLIGYSCQKNAASQNVCTAQVDAKGKCSQDYDCKNNMGCLNGVCTAYYSIEDGQNAKEISSFLNKYSFCKSGASDVNGVCYTRNNENALNKPCDQINTCKYDKKVDLGEDVHDCNCGKGPMGRSYCQLGNGSPIFMDFVAKSKALLSANSANCHTLERGDKCALINGNADDVASFNNARVNANSYSSLVGVEDCIIPIFYPEYTGKAPKPYVKQCPKFTCDKSIEGCADFRSTETGERSDKLKICDDKEKSLCIIDQLQINSDKNYTSSCTTPITPPVPSVYPGEKCKWGDKCMGAESQCQNSTLTCKGLEAEKVCAENIDCNAGLYCKLNLKTSKKECHPQEKIGNICAKTNDCVNNAVCYGLKCTEIYSFKSNATMDKSLLDSENAEILCETKMLDVVNKKCDSKKKGKDDIVATNGLVKCNYSTGQKCNMTLAISNVNQQVDCLCSYNPNGESFCPLAHDQEKSSWDKLYQAERNYMNNQCHTLNRNCQMAQDSSKLKTRNNLYRSTIDAVKFHEAPDCVIRMFDSANFINFGLMTLFGILALMF